MQEDRHPHPHVDPRRPRNLARPGTNPPVFAWKPCKTESGYRLMVGREPSLSDPVLDLPGLREPSHLPEKAFAPGRYFWKWSADGRDSQTFQFEIAPEAVKLEVPSAREWLARLPASHPRIYVRPEDLPELRRSLSRQRPQMWATLMAQADELLREPHEIEEPPYLPDRLVDYQRNFEIWLGILRESRRFVQGARTLALAYLVGGRVEHARAACRRMASISCWDPDGSSHPDHNDEAHMSVIWDGPAACDWVWDQFTDEERRRVIDQFRRRARINYERMHNRGSYGVSRFDSHAGREVVFLALIGMTFHEHIPEAVTWLEWLRPVLCGIWPIWAGDDGAWSEGPSYGLAYVEIMTMFASALKRGAGIDLYRRPFWANHARWRQWCVPPYIEWLGFGDQTERRPGAWQESADLVELIAHETGTGEFDGYVQELRREAKDASPDVMPQLFLAPPGEAAKKRAAEPAAHRVFPGAGWAAVRTDLTDPARDLALIFRSSPFGAYSHSHANQNDFILHVAGKVLAMPSGYYDGYGSKHHIHWVWHTKSHNCVTLSDGGQLMSSHDSVGAVEADFEDERLAYFRGNADAAYRDRARRCRRHVVFLKNPRCFVLVDEFEAVPGIASALQWNIHAWSPFTIDPTARTFATERLGSSLVGHFMHHHESFFSLTDGWDPPPMAAKGRNTEQWLPQYHLRFTPAGLAERRALGVVLCPGHAGLTPATVGTERAGEVELARIGQEDVVVVNPNGAGPIGYQDFRADALALLIASGARYALREGGVVRD